MPSINEVLVPPRRLGALLRESRVTAGDSLDDVAARSGRLTVVDLDDLENGRRTLDDELLREVVDVYGVEGEHLLPQRSRLMIDLDEGLISVDATHVAVESDRADEVLTRYLALVHRLRGQSVGTALKIRELDIGILATALELGDDEIELRLQRLMSDGDSVRKRERDLRRRVLVPLAGVVVASTAVGVLVLVSDDGDIGSTDPDRVMMQVPTDIGDAAVVEAGATAPLAPSEADVDEPGVVTEVGDAAIIESGGQQEKRD